MTAKVISFLFICTMELELQVCAQQNHPFVKHITEKDGLSNSNCRAVLKDSDGFVWIATENGLNRYDGSRFVHCKNNVSDSTSIGGNSVYDLHEDSHRNIWVSGINVLSRYSMDEHRFFNYAVNTAHPNKYNGGYIESCFSDKAGRLWFCITGSGLLLYRPATDDFEYILPDVKNLSSSANRVAAITQDSSGIYWLATHGGLYSFDFTSKEFEHHPYAADGLKDSFFYNQCLSITNDLTDKNLLWYGTWGTGLHSYNKRTGESEMYKYLADGPINLTNIVFEIKQRDEHSLWIATETGLAIFDLDKHSFEFLKNDGADDNSISAGEVKQVYVDDEGIVWLPMGTGVDVIDPHLQKFQAMTLATQPNLNEVIWLSKLNLLLGNRIYSNRSVCVVNPTTQEMKQYSIPLADEKKSEPFELFELSDGRVVIGMVRSNPIVFYPESGRFGILPLSTLLQMSEENLDVRDMVEDDDKNLWMGNYGGGVIRYSLITGEAKMYASLQKDASLGFATSVTWISQHQGMIYATVQGKGIIVINSKTDELRFVPFEENALKDMSDMAMDQQGDFWISTFSHGLLKCSVSDKVVIERRFYNEFPDVNLRSIYVDRSSNIWLYSSSGLIRFDAASSSAELFNENDGLNFRNLISTLCEAPDGAFYFTVRGGVGKFYPSQLKESTSSFRCVLNMFNVSEKQFITPLQLSGMREVVLQPFQNNFTFDYTALSYSYAGKLEYAYRLSGFEEDWHYTGSEHGGTYTNLPPGTYTLQMNCKLKNADWPQQSSTIVVTVLPRFYQTWWCRLLLFAAFVAVVLLGIKTYTRSRLRRVQAELERQRSIEQIRTRISRDIHDEIGAGLTKISLMSKRIERTVGDEEKTKTEAKNIGKASIQLVQNLGEIVWTINPQNDSLADLIGYVRSYTTTLFENTEMDFELQLPELNDAMHKHILNPELKRNFLLIIKESSNNIIKHSNADKVKLSIACTMENLLLTIEDNGVGFAIEEKQRTGNGLRNMQKRAESMEAICSITSKPNEGTRTKLEVKIGKHHKS